MTTDTVTSFNQLALKAPLLKALDEVGYETPSPIQALTIPLMLQGGDVLGQAQTGTGKTAAFALPILSELDLKQKNPQVLVLAPTRELAIQVAEAFQKYACHMQGFHVLPVYGGQDYRSQIRALQRGVHVVVGTPGRVMDHMRRGTLILDQLTTLVLDEADEMLRMGFIDDVEWVLEQLPEKRQIALFSATMPTQIRRIAAKYLNKPTEVTIKVKTTTAETIRQRYWVVSGLHKLDALTRILEAETFEAMIIFVRTKTATVELSEKLEARGYASAAINGDIQQNQRERTIQQLKNGKLDILVATDVAARGLDVERVSHVINYDVPYDTEAYVHRIGRTGRAGRHGDAILFVAPREKRMLSAIERATNKKIEQMDLPTTDFINSKRIDRFKQSITDALASEELELFTRLIEQYQQEHDVPAKKIAAALAHLLQGDTPLLLQNKPRRKDESNRRGESSRQNDDRASSRKGEGSRHNDERPNSRPSRDRDSREHHLNDDREPRERSRSTPKPVPLEKGMDRYRIEVGHNHEVKPGNIVGAIANEANIDSQYIGHIKIYDDHSLVDLPEGMPKEVLRDLKKAWVAGQQMKISRVVIERNPKSAAKSDARAEVRSDTRSNARPNTKPSPRLDSKPNAKSSTKPSAASDRVERKPKVRKKIKVKPKTDGKQKIRKKTKS